MIVEMLEQMEEASDPCCVFYEDYGGSLLISFSSCSSQTNFPNQYDSSSFTLLRSDFNLKHYSKVYGDNLTRILSVNLRN